MIPTQNKKIEDMYKEKLTKLANHTIANIVDLLDRHWKHPISADKTMNLITILIKHYERDEVEMRKHLIRDIAK